MNKTSHFVIWPWAAFLLGAASQAGWAASPVIREETNQIVLANDVGAKLVIARRDGKYGMGTFYVNGVALGAPVERFLSEGDLGDNSRDSFQKLWPGAWDPGFKATTYEILENDPGRGVIRFSGKEGNPPGSVTITLARGAAAYRLDYEITPSKSIKHPLYACAPFFPEKMEFVQFPFENPLTPPFRKRWAVHPTRSTVPLLFGCERIKGHDYYVGVGYRLDQDYERGEFEYDASEPAPFKIRFFSPHASGWLGRPLPGGKVQPYRLSIVISTATTQYDCITGYRLHSGYDISTPIRRGLDESIAGIMAMYKNSSAYVSLPPFKSSAYRQQIDPQTGKPPEKGYGAYIPVGVNVQLAEQLYRHWQAHPEETWARERAIQMANFFVEAQNASGAVPTLWDPKEKRFRAYQPLIDKRGYIYATCQQAMGAYALYKLYAARKTAENIDEQAWRDAAKRAMDDLIGKIQPDGLLGRNYDAKGNYDSACAPGWALVALNYFAEQTGDARYDEARERLERWAYRTFIRTNHWFGWSSDAGWWVLSSPPPFDVDALNSFTLATYSVLRHMRTGDPKYLDWAKTIVSYNWLVAIPTQFPEFKHVTKGLVREQDFYPTSDLPFRTCLYVDGLPYLSIATGDRFFMDFYRLMIQTQMAYQNTPPRMQSFDLGLWWDPSGGDPADETGEPDHNYIVEFCSLFLESVTSPNAYRYVGGPGWGQGLDYDLPFTPSLDRSGPYAISSSNRLTKASWDAQTKTLHLGLDGRAGDRGTAAVGWETAAGLGTPRVFIDGKPTAPDQCHRELQNGREVLKMEYAQRSSATAIEVSFP